MLKFSQNLKILVAALSVFVISLSVILFFLESHDTTLEEVQTNVLSHSGAEEEEGAENPLEQVYREKIEDEDVEELPFFVTDAGGKFVYLTEEFCELLERSCKKLAGKVLFEYVNAKDLPELVVADTRVINKKEPLKGAGPYRLDAQEKEKVLIFNVYPILNNNKQISKMIFAVKDITDQVKDFGKKGESGWTRVVSPGVAIN